MRDKQIEEMSKTIADCGICIYHGDVCTREEEVSDDLALCIARVLNEQGYRKSSDVAMEIFDEIEKRIADLEYKANTTRKTVKVEELKAQINWVLHEVIPATIAELKKKYESEGEG